MSVGRVSSSTTPGSVFGAADASKAVAHVVHSSDAQSRSTLAELVRSEWVKGEVIGIRDGAMQVRTSFGDLLLALRSSAITTGTRLLLSYDQTSGRVNVRPDIGPDPKAAPPKEALSTAQSPLTQTRPSLPGLLAASQASPASPASPPANAMQSTQALSAAFPSATSAAFALVVALFPMTVRGGILGRLASQQSRRYGASSRLVDLASKSALKPVGSVDGNAHALGWQMPYFSQGEIHMTRWRESEEPVFDAPERRLRRVFLEAGFDFCGLLQIDAVLDQEHLSLTITTERPLPQSLIDSLQEIASVLSSAFTLRTRFSYLFGEEYLDRSEARLETDQR